MSNDDKTERRMSKYDAARQLRENEALAIAALQRCNCKEPIRLRKYVGHWQCAICMRPQMAG